MRWVENPGPPVAAPADAAGPTTAHALVSQSAAGTLPCPGDLADDRLAAGSERARRRLLAAQRAVGTSTPASDVDLWQLRPESQMFGHPWSCEREAQERLAAAAPPPVDEWVLLADLAGVAALDGWFGDEGHLEVWLRAADVTDCALDRAWVLLRG